MAIEEDRDLMARLLSGRDRSSRLEKEAIFQAVVEALPEHKQPRRWLKAALAGGALVSSTAIMIVLFTPLDPPFQTRGEDANFHVFCEEHGKTSPCKQGSRLHFDVTPPHAHTFFAAFSERPDGTVIWYFPSSAKGPGLNLKRHSRQGLLDTGIQLGPEHTPGRYRVYGYFSKTPLSRDDIRTQSQSGEAQGLVERSLVIE